MSRSAIHGVAALVVAAVPLWVGTASARPLPCGVDVEALGAYLRTGEGTGAVVAAPVAGQQLYPHLNYRVVGASESPSAQLAVRIDGGLVCDPAPFGFALGFGAVVYCRQPWSATVGTHTLRWEINADGALAETNGSNDVAETTFTVTPGPVPDLIGTRVYLRTGHFEGAEVQRPNAGEDVYLHLDYRVAGTAGEVTADLSVLVDGQVYCAGSVEFQTGGTASFGCDQPWRAEAGAHTIQWFLDANSAVPEADESNNAPALELNVVAPAGIDFQVLRAYLRGSTGHAVATPACGQSIYFYFDYQLLGTSDAVWARGRVLIDGAPHCQGAAPAPGGAPTFVFCSNPWIAAPGRHTIRLELDVPNDVVETDESNNAIDLTFDVGAATACVGDCDGDGSVSIAELITAVNIALGSRPLDDCPSLDVDGDGQVAINELIAAVGNALDGCPE